MADILKRIRGKPAIILGAILIVILAVGAGFFGYKNGFLGSNSVSVPNQNEVVGVTQKVEVLQDEVNVQKSGKDTKLSQGQEQEIAAGDRIATGKTGIAVLNYSSGTVVRIGPNTTLVFQSQNNLFQEIGKIYVRFKKVLGSEEFNVESETAIAAVRGTAFASIIESNKDHRILVTEHEVEVSPKDINGKVLENLKKVIKIGEEGRVSNLRRLLTVLLQKLLPEDKEWLDFNAGLDISPNDRSLLDRFPSLRVIKSTPTPSPTPSPSGTPKPTPVPLSSFTTMPGAGYHKGSVATSFGTFPLACYGASKGGVRMLTDSASDQDCRDNCPVLPLDAYATRNGGIAAMNGMYFCPADYPACAGKVNTFDTLFFNSRTRNYMNSDNNVYSTIPFVGMNSDHSMNFVGASSSWGRDTGIIGGTAGNPMLTSGGNYVVNEGALDDKQRSVKSNRGAIVQESDMIYLCITQGATVIDSGHVYAQLGADNAINVDGGGSSALWVQGSYKYGPGRQIPTAIILAP